MEENSPPKALVVAVLVMEAAEGTVRVRVRVEAAPMTTGVLALKTMNVSTLQYCSVLMFVNIHARKATDTQKKLWCSAGTHE